MPEPTLLEARDPLDEGAVLADVLAAHRRKRAWRRLGRWSLAVVNLLLGVVGLFFPVIQGLLHLMIGVALLAPDLPPARRATLWLYRRLPRIRRALPRAIRNLTRKQKD